MADIKKYSSTPEFVSRRNERLVNFLAHNGLKKIRLIGNENMPAVLYNDQFLLPCYVKNFDLVFMDNGKDHKFKLQTEPTKADLSAFVEKAKKIFRLKMKGFELFVCGWNYKGETRQPVWGNSDPKVYFNKTKVESILKELADKGYNCELL